MAQRMERSIPIELKSLLATMDQVSRKFPGCEKVRHTFAEFWGPSEWDVAEEDLSEMRRYMAHFINRWLHDATEKDIAQRIRRLPPVARIAIKDLVRPQYQHFFDRSYKGLPIDFAAPSPFLVMERKAGNWFPLNKPLIRKWGEEGKIKISMLGTALKAEDGQLTYALLQILRTKKAEFTRKNIYFRTTRTEIAKAMYRRNPWDPDTREAIWDGLKRLRACVMELTNARGFRTIGGILDGARELEEDSAYEIGIYLDRNFIDLIEEGYVELEPEVFQKLSPREANLYKFLMHHESFNQSGYLKRPIGIAKVYDAAGLCGLQTDTPTCEIRHRLRQALRGLQNALVELNSKHRITHYSIKNDQLTITSKEGKSADPQSEFRRVSRQADPDVEPIVAGPTAVEPRNSCPYGHRFHTDLNDFPECDGCEITLDCMMAI